MKWTTVGIAVVLFLSACDSITAPERGLEISANYVTSTAPGTIFYEIVNHSPQLLYVAACDGQPLVAVEAEESGEWINVSAAVCQTIYDMSPLPMPPGVRLSGYRAVEQSGRLRVIAYAATATGAQTSTLISDAVTVTP